MTTASSRPKTTTAKDTIGFRSKVSVQGRFENKLAAGLDDDDSIFNDSQASRQREEKQAILYEQQAKRKADLAFEKRKLEEQKQRRLKNLNGLTSKFRANPRAEAKKASRAKSRERSKSRKEEKRVEKLVEQHRPDRT